MSETKIKARTILLQYSEDGVVAYLPVACSTEDSFESTIAAIDANTKCGNEMLAGDIVEQSISISGQTITITGIPAKVSTSDLYTIHSTKINGFWKYGPVTPVTGDVTLSFRGVVDSLTINNSDGELQTFDANITVTNAPATKATQA